MLGDDARAYNTLSAFFFDLIGTMHADARHAPSVRRDRQLNQLNVELSASDLKQILFFYCHDCSSKDDTLKTIYKDYTNSKEHAKPLFKKHNILSIFNLYPYFCLNETYKILKFRTPYSLYELLDLPSDRTGRNLLLKTRAIGSRHEEKSFFSQSIRFWNKHHKKIIEPSNVKLHEECSKKLNLVGTDFSLTSPPKFLHSKLS